MKYKSYTVYDDGTIVNRHGHVMKPYINKQGSLVVMLRDNGKRICPTVARVLYEAQQGSLPPQTRMAHSDPKDGLSLAPRTNNKSIYRSTSLRRKQEIIDMRSQLTDPKQIQILDWVLGGEIDDTNR